MCILYWKIKKKNSTKKGEKRNNTIKKYVVHSSALLRCEFILRFKQHIQKKIIFIRGWIFFVVFPSAIFPFSLYLCIESILYFNSIVSECYERCTFEPKLYTMHNHPSLIHSFSLPSIYNFFPTFTCSLIHSGNSLSFCFDFFFSLLLLLFMYQTAFFDVTLIFPSSQYFLHIVRDVNDECEKKEHREQFPFIFN